VPTSDRPQPESIPPRGAGEKLRFGLGVVLVALCASAFAIAFRLALSFLLHRTSNADNVVTVITRAPTWARVLLPALGGLVAGSISLLLRERSDHGVGGVMEAVVLGRGRLSLSGSLLKSLASFAAIVTGGSLGREGPLIQLGAASGQVWSGWLGLTSRRRRTLIAAGTAAGFAAAYNTPFAAVLFVLEVVLGVFVLDAVLPILAATVLGTAVTRAVVGAGPIYGERSFSTVSSVELLAVVGLGLVAALGAQAFMRLLSFAEGLFARSKLPLPWRPALGGLLCGGLMLFLPEVAGNGYEPLNQLLDGHFSYGFVAALLVAKCLATSASVSSGSPGGVFTPTLLLGGGIGFLYFGLLKAGLDLELGHAGGYALVGMAAATAATTHAPLMAAVMAFELSGDYAIVLPLLIATAVATALSRRLRRDSIYNAELRRRGVSWELTLEGRKITS
jgi:CIC family chloride channel protein